MKSIAKLPLGWRRVTSHSSCQSMLVSFSLSKGRGSDGFPLGMEDFIRQAIKEFDFPDCTIFTQLVKIIAPVEKVLHLVQWRHKVLHLVQWRHKVLHLLQWHHKVLHLVQWRHKVLHLVQYTAVLCDVTRYSTLFCTQQYFVTSQGTPPCSVTSQVFLDLQFFLFVLLTPILTFLRN